MEKYTFLYKIVDTLCNEGNIDNLLDIPEIDSKRRYWVIRSTSGNFWGDYKNNSFVAIGHNDYTYKMIYDACKQDKIDSLKKLIEEKENTSRPGIIINQIKKFYEDIKCGDVIITPSKNSDIISFGIVTSDAYEGEINSNAEFDEGICTYYKRRDVEWIIDVPYDKLDPYLYKLFCAHQAIFDAKEYSKFIDRTMYPLFVKNNLVHLRIDVNTTDDISTESLSYLLNLCSTDSLNYNNNSKVIAKLAVQSPGLIEFISNKFNIASLLTLLSCNAVPIRGGVALFTKAVKDYQDIKKKNNDIKFQENEEKRKQEAHELEMELKRTEEKRKQEIHEFEMNLKKSNFINDNLSLEKVDETSKELDLGIPNIIDYINKKEQN